MWRRLILGVWLLSLPVGTWVRCHVWRSERALWANAVQGSPLKPRPRINLGRALEIEGDLEGAEREYRLTISLSFDARRSPTTQRLSRASAENNIAHLYMKIGRNGSALKVLDQILEDWPTFPYALYNRAVLLSAVGACDEALADTQIVRLYRDLAFPPMPECYP